MIRAVLIFFLASCVNTQMNSMQHSVYVSRKSRSNSEPLETGYVYSKVDSHPGTFAMYESGGNDYNSYGIGKFNDYSNSDASNYDSKLYASRFMPSNSLDASRASGSSFVNPTPSYNYEYEKSKTEAEYDAHYLPIKMRSDAMYEKLKSLMHYKYPEGSEMHDMNYDIYSDYHHIDDDDVRSSSRVSYDGWPYFYHNPYEYEAMKIDSKIDSEIEKVKDKRYASTPTKDIIPVHENVDDIPNTYAPAVITTSRSSRQITTDNPNYGNKPFYSYVLNDYSDKNVQDDHLNFKGLDWGKEFDHGSPVPAQDNSLKRDRRLPNSFAAVNDVQNNGKFSNNFDTSKAAAGESATEKGYSKKHEFKKHEKGDDQKENHKSAYEQNGHKYNGFKDFVDTFANKFGGEENKKDSKYILKKEQDKGEKRKGFRRVYHKDEYAEDNEFFDNSKNSAKSEEKGGSAFHNGGSHAILQSHAAAASGNDANAFNKAGNSENKKFENNHSGHSFDKGNDSQFNNYRDVAQLAARNNGADYIDYFGH